MQRIIIYCKGKKIKETPLAGGPVPANGDVIVVDTVAYRVVDRAFIYNDSALVVLLKVEHLDDQSYIPR